MTRLRTLVLEDEWPARNYLVQLIEASQLADVVGAVASVAEAREALAALAVDVVFLDVQLAGGETGLELVQQLPGGPAFVLATAFSQHALKAWDLGVVDYLLKPFSEKRVEQCLRRIAARRESRGAGALRVVARRKRSLVFLDPADIWAFEASERLTYVHSRLGKFDIDLSLATIALRQDKLRPRGEEQAAGESQRDESGHRGDRNQLIEDDDLVAHRLLGRGAADDLSGHHPRQGDQAHREQAVDGRQERGPQRGAHLPLQRLLGCGA